MKRIINHSHLPSLCANVRSVHFPRSRLGTTRSSSNTTTHPTIEEVLSKPSWSVSSLLHPPERSSTSPSTSSSQPPPTESTPITPDTLRKLLRLAALPYPETKEEEEKMLARLQSQINFVREVQNVNTRGVAPLRSIRDESDEAERENEITVDSLKDAFAREKVVGKHYKRIRRVGSLPGEDNDDGKAAVGEWDVFGQSVRRIGNYFVVDHGRGQEVKKSEEA